MASKYFIVVRPDSPAFDVEHLVQRLRAQNPTMDDFGMDAFRNRQWAIGNSGPSPVRGQFDDDGRSLILEGALESVAPVAIALRRLVPPSTALEMCDEEYTWSSELLQTMSAGDILRLE